MMNRDVLKEYDIKQEEIEKELAEIIKDNSLEQFDEVYNSSVKNFELGTILRGKDYDN